MPFRDLWVCRPVLSAGHACTQRPSHSLSSAPPTARTPHHVRSSSTKADVSKFNQNTSNLFEAGLSLHGIGRRWISGTNYLSYEMFELELPLIPMLLRGLQLFILEPSGLTGRAGCPTSIASFCSRFSDNALSCEFRRRYLRQRLFGQRFPKTDRGYRAHSSPWRLTCRSRYGSRAFHSGVMLCG
jgi:hypothetical protein